MSYPQNDTIQNMNQADNTRGMIPVQPVLLKWCIQLLISLKPHLM